MNPDSSQVVWTWARMLAKTKEVWHMRRDAKVDGNQAEIVEALRAAGYQVLDLHRMGQGVPDLLVVSKSGQNILLEVKVPGGRLTTAEQRFIGDWTGALEIVASVEDALTAMLYYD